MDGSIPDPIHTTGEITSTVACPECGRAIIPRDHKQVTCGDKLCQSRRHWKRAKVNPSKQVANVLRCRKWDADHGRNTRSQPMLMRAPIYPRTHLPGGGFEMTISPPPRFPLTLENGRSLHGMVTALLDVGHESTDPTFSLVPWPSGCGWGIYVWRDDMIARLDGRTIHGRLDSTKVDVTFSPVRRLRVPTVEKRAGRRRLVLSTVTPVVIRRQVDNPKSPGKRTIGYRTEPSAEALEHSLGAQFIRRLASAIDEGPIRDFFLTTRPAFELVEAHTDKANGRYQKIGEVEGWEGTIVVDTNAPGEWLLRVAALVGLGGRCGFGFGRIRVGSIEEAKIHVPTKRGASGPWFVGPHAVSRFQREVPRSREWDHDRVVAELVDQARGAHRVKTLASGAELWRGPRPERLRFIVQPQSEGELPALATVLPACDR